MSEFSLVCHQQRQRGKIFIQHYCLPSFLIRGTRLSLSLSKSFTVFCPCLSVRVSPFLPPQGADCISMTSLLLRVSNLTKKTSHHTSVCLVHFVSFLYAFLCSISCAAILDRRKKFSLFILWLEALAWLLGRFMLNLHL